MSNWILNGIIWPEAVCMWYRYHIYIYVCMVTSKTSMYKFDILCKNFHLDSLYFQNNFTDFHRITLKCHKVQWWKLRRNIVCFKLFWACDEQIRNNLEWNLLALINVLLLFSAENSRTFFTFINKYYTSWNRT